MGYATISLFRSLTNLNKDLIPDSSLNAIIPIADRLVNKLISTKVHLEKLFGQIDGTNKDFRTKHFPLADTDLKNVTNVDSCDVTNWTASTDAVAASLTGKLVEGLASLSLGKSGSTEAFVNYTKTEGSTVDGTGRRLRVTIFIKDTQQLALNNALELRIGNDSSNYYVITLPRDALKNGINEIDIPITDMGTVGTTVITALDYLYINFSVAAAADTITAGDLKMDYWRLEDIDTPDTADFEVFYATTDDNSGFTEYGSAQTVASVQPQSGIITMNTAPTTSTAEAGVFANYAHVSGNMDWNLVNPAACYMAAHLSSFIVAGKAPNYRNIEDSFARRDLAGAPDEWLRLSLSLLMEAVGESAGGIGFRNVQTKDLT